MTRIIGLREKLSIMVFRLMSSYPIAFCDFLDGHQIGCGSKVADAIFFLQHRLHLLKGFTHGLIETRPANQIDFICAGFELVRNFPKAPTRYPEMPTGHPAP